MSLGGALIGVMIATALDLREAQARGQDGERLWAEFNELGILLFAQGESGGHRWSKSVEVRWREVIQNPDTLRLSAAEIIRTAGLAKK